MGLMDKTEKLVEAMAKYNIEDDGSIVLESASKDELFNDLKLISEIALMLSAKLVAIDDQVIGWELASRIMEEIDTPFFEGAYVTLESNIKVINDIMDSDL